MTAQYAGARTSPLRGIRAYRGLSQGQLADQASLSRGTISRLENGHEAPTLRTVRKLAVVLEFDPRVLFPLNDAGQAGNLAGSRIAGEAATRAPG